MVSPLRLLWRTGHQSLYGVEDNIVLTLESSEPLHNLEVISFIHLPGSEGQNDKSFHPSFDKLHPRDEWIRRGERRNRISNTAAVSESCVLVLQRRIIVTMARKHFVYNKEYPISDADK